MKPVNLNQLLFHPKTSCLSFYQVPLSNESEESFTTFFDDMQAQLELQGKENLKALLTKYKTHIRKVLKAHPEKSHGFYISDELQGYVILEELLESFCMMGSTFHVRPLLEQLFVNPEFLIVNISLYDIKIYKADFHHVEIVQHYEFDEIPKSLAQHRIYAPNVGLIPYKSILALKTLAQKVMDMTLYQSYPVVVTGLEEMKKIFLKYYEHTSGVISHVGLIPYKSILALKTLAQKVMDMTLYQSYPVVVTGLEEMKKIFLKYYEHTSGVISHVEADFFEKTCMEILDSCKLFRPSIMDFYSAQLKERLKRMMKSQRIISDLGTIIEAVRKGEVIHLVLPVEKKIWGRIDLTTGEFEIHKRVQKKTPSVDILNELAEEVIKNGGKIQFLGPHFFPGEAQVLALLKGSA